MIHRQDSVGQVTVHSEGSGMVKGIGPHFAKPPSQKTALLILNHRICQPKKTFIKKKQLRAASHDDHYRPRSPPAIAHGGQQMNLFNTKYQDYCYLPLMIFEGLSGQLITAVLHPGKTPTGKENAAILKGVIKLIRKRWPKTH